jgi:hypothetical protein
MPAQKVHARGLTSKDREFDNMLRCAAQRWQRYVIDSTGRKAGSLGGTRCHRPALELLRGSLRP